MAYIFRSWTFLILTSTRQVQQTSSTLLSLRIKTSGPPNVATRVYKD